MSQNSRSRLSLLPIMAALALAAGCVAVDGSTPITEGATLKEETRAGIEQWKCGYYFDGCGFLATDCVTLNANLYDGTGDVKFGEIWEDTNFQIEGLERRWDWCLKDDGYYDCAFVISVDGSGRYYNFRGSEDGRAKPRDLFKCTRR